jgi:hypothetical protein
MVLNVVLRLVPTKVNAAIAATAIKRGNQRVLDRRDARLIVDEL